MATIQIAVEVPEATCAECGRTKAVDAKQILDVRPSGRGHGYPFVATAKQHVPSNWQQVQVGGLLTICPDCYSAVCAVLNHAIARLR